MRNFINKFVLSFIALRILDFYVVNTENLVCNEVTIISRKEWGAANGVEVNAKKIVNPQINVNYVVVHHTATENCTTTDECKNKLKEIENFDLDVLDNSDISMHFYIGGDGLIFEGRGWGVEQEDIPDHPFAFNIAFIGNFSSVLPQTKSLFNAQKLIQCGARLGQISKRYRTYGHSALRCTNCPGEKLYVKIREWPSFEIPTNITKRC